MAHALSESGLSQTNYDNTLIGWSAQSVQSNVTFGAENLIYCAAVAERNSLITNNGWNIRGDSQCASTRQSDDSVEIVEITENEVFEFSNFEKVSVYPVPTGGGLTLTYDLKVDEEVEVFVRDIAGKLVYLKNEEGKAGINNTAINLSAYKDGLYFLQLTNGEQTVTRKVIKQP